MKVAIVSDENNPGYVRREFLDAFLTLGESVHIKPLKINGLYYLDMEYIKSLSLDLLIFGDLFQVPQNIADVPCKTACFQFDTYAITEKRINESRLFDFPIIFHPEYIQEFKKRGLENTLGISYSIDKKKIRQILPNDQEFEVVSVGDIKRKQYSVRRKFLLSLQNKFRHNRFEQWYNWDEMIALYKASKIVINIPRNDFLKDANLRCYEAMGSGAMLLTYFPSELEFFGFRPKAHFDYFSSEAELLEKIKYYLHNDDKRLAIAKRAQAEVEENFTYEQYAAQIISHSQSIKGFNRIDDSTEKSYIFFKDYFYGKKFGLAFQELKKIVKKYPLKSGSFLVKFFFVLIYRELTKRFRTEKTH